MAYNVLVINGSPKANGCTATALDEVIRTLNQEGIETTLLQIGKEDVHGCISCGYCSTHDGCSTKPRSSLKKPTDFSSEARPIMVHPMVRFSPFSTGSSTARASRNK